MGDQPLYILMQKKGFLCPKCLIKIAHFRVYGGVLRRVACSTSLWHPPRLLGRSR